jgi:hypothetical protein
MTKEVKLETLYFENRVEAEFVLSHLMDKAAVCKGVTFKDYNMAVLSFTNADSEEYGWTEETISNTRILKGNKGFYLNLPDPIRL